MRDLTIRDATQVALLPYLERTERMLAKAASAASGRSCDAEVVALSDLGIATNVGRMLSGFFTGALYRWDAPVPIVPVDATVNVCSVSLHRVSSTPGSQDEFMALIDQARRRSFQEAGVRWNLAAGNHFASLGTIRDSGPVADGDYLMLHASASEYKRTPQGLYPGPKSWFDRYVETVDDGSTSLRYIAGSAAERFIARAHSLVGYNALRHDVIASLIGEELGVQRIGHLPHYGMPDDASVAIGCNWFASGPPSWFPLLTEPDADIPIIVPEPGCITVDLAQGDHMIAPHGLGVRSANGTVGIDDAALELGDSKLGAAAGVLDDSATEWRSLRRDSDLLDRVLSVSPGSVSGWFTPVFSYHRGVSEDREQR